MKVSFIKTHLNAITPTKAHSTDIGYDLTVIGIWKVLSDKTVIYETGIAVKPPKGMYIEILPRSSITKTGYMLANSVGVIDPDYTSSLKIGVRKIDDSFPDFELPFCKFQIVLRTAYMFEMEEVKMLEETERGGGGFGSSG